MNKDIIIMREAKEKELTRLKSIVDSFEIDNGADNCPFCELFLDDNCSACPVYLRTGHAFCRLSPYAEWVRHQSEIHYKMQPPYKIECDVCKERIQKVYEFIQSAPLFMEDQLDIWTAKKK